METKNILIFGCLVFVLLAGVQAQATVTGAAIVVDADYVTVLPGQQGNIDINVENKESFDIEDVSVSLVLDNLPFTSVGSSSKEIDEINEDDDDSVGFTIKAATDITPGDYSIPYRVKYTEAGESSVFEKTGTFGIRVSSKTELSYSVESENNVVEERGRVSIKIVNSGLGDVRFVNVKIISNTGMELLSVNEDYVGTVDSDDFELATFDMLFKQENANVNALITYKDFENKDQSQTVNLPVKVYSREKALELGIIQKNNNALYLGVVVILVILWFVWRTIKKRRKKKNRENNLRR